VKHPEKGSALDQRVQKTVTSLEHGKERIARIADTARREHETFLQSLGQLQGEVRALAAETGALESQVAAATSNLREAAARGAGADALLEACDALAGAKAALLIARSRQAQAGDSQDSHEDRIHRTGQIAEEGASLVQELAHAIDFLAANFRELSHWLESAQQSRALGLHVIRAQEEERRRLAREIHDGPTQLLNSVVLRIDVCMRCFDTDPGRVKDELQQLKELVRLSLQDVRKIIFDLRPMALDDLGLVPALRSFLKDYQARTGIETDFTVFGNDRRYDSAFEIAIFRLVQESLTNVHKHAGATRVWVKVETTGGSQVKVQVKDDGQGFDPELVRPGTGGAKFGLVAMRERTELLGGSMEIQSSPGQGAKLNFLFPLPE